MVTREYWLATMLKTADPVLTALAENRLKSTLPMDFHPDRTLYAPLEAFGRTLCGMAPWLDAKVPEGEREVQRRYRALVQSCMASAVDPSAPDFMNFTEGYGQSLVDAAFLAHAVLRAPETLWRGLTEKTRRDLSAALRSTRKFTPYRSNWLFFSAMIEIALRRVGEAYDMAPVDRALDAFQGWYVGDGMYSDGDYFHMDYYNSFVIHPMMADILRELKGEEKYAELYETELRRAKRYAGILERLIMPDGSYPLVGRSVTYRYGAFQLLAQAALQDFLPENVTPASVRCALTAVLRRVGGTGIYDENGFLLPGVAGHQPNQAEGYIGIGSLYLCETVFLPLALPPAHPFWSAPDEPWTQKRLWSCENAPLDRAED